MGGMDSTSKGRCTSWRHFLLQYANEKGVAIYYISNRKQNQLDATLQNLQKLNIPQADTEHVLLQGKDEKERKSGEKVATEHDIVLFLEIIYLILRDLMRNLYQIEIKRLKRCTKHLEKMYCVPESHVWRLGSCFISIRL